HFLLKFISEYMLHYLNEKYQYYIKRRVMHNKKLYLFLLICFPLVIVASETPETPEFLKAFYKDVDPKKIPIGLIVWMPHEHNKNVRLNFILYNTLDNTKTIINDDYQNLVTKTWYNTSFDIKYQKSDNNLHFAVNDFFIAKVSIDHLYQAV